ncbi:MAG TPA: hypothetical protein VOA41_11535, partial [Candidatus Dormibacteraeota bacterium]|nr:hypothetical protein [Candidatus Dormibacteraeota bacterium]
QTTENLDTIEAVEIGEIASIHALLMHVAEKIAGCSKRLGEYPTLSAIPFRSFIFGDLQFWCLSKWRARGP